MVDAGALRRLIRDVPDFPSPGIVFRDITPLLADPAGLGSAVDHLAAPLRDLGLTHVAGIEARGFLLAVPVAVALGVGFVPIRKPGKLPRSTATVSYALEYGRDTLEMHDDAFGEGARVAVLDDVLATGGTARAAVDLVTGTGASVVAAAFLLELCALGGRDRLGGQQVESVLQY
ncbi:MAG: adenine phosphoribosyltransferase [Acidimicrobiia bacterium]|nr:adenine phosphoribosyltransferase [Acidimicrobiia bacterium]